MNHLTKEGPWLPAVPGHQHLSCMEGESWVSTGALAWCIGCGIPPAGPQGPLAEAHRRNIIATAARGGFRPPQALGMWMGRDVWKLAACTRPGWQGVGEGLCVGNLIEARQPSSFAMAIVRGE